MAANVGETDGAVDNDLLPFELSCEITRPNPQTRIYEQSIPAAEDAQPLEMGTELTLKDDGEFVFREFWHDLVGRGGLTVSGRWSQTGDKVLLYAESSTNPYLWQIGTAVKAVEQGATLKLKNGGVLSARPLSGSSIGLSKQPPSAVAFFSADR